MSTYDEAVRGVEAGQVRDLATGGVEAVQTRMLRASEDCEKAEAS